MRPRPLDELRSFQFPAWIMWVWVGWLLLASPILLGLLARIGVPPVIIGVGWVASTVGIYLRTWHRHGHRVDADDSIEE